MTKILSREFFNEPVLKIAPKLLGKYLIRKIDNQEIALQITEIEAYDGMNDLACHACKGKTKRNKVMFGPAGCFYLYLIYGMYWMLNIVTGPKDYPAAILIRGTKEISGPGRLTKKLKLDKNFNTKTALPENNLWFEDRDIKVLKKDIIQTSRIGVNYAGPLWAKKPYRFLLKK